MNVLKPHLQTTIWTLLRAGNNNIMRHNLDYNNTDVATPWDASSIPVWGLNRRPQKTAGGDYNGKIQLRIIAMRPMATTTPMTPEAATAPHVPSFGLSQ